MQCNKLPKWLLPSSLFPGEVPVASCLFQRLSNIVQWVCPKLLSNNCLWLGLRACEILHAPFKSRDSVSYSSPALLNIRSTSLQSHTCWRLIFPAQDPGLGSLMWGSDPLLLGEDLYNCDISPICGSLTQASGSYLYPSYLSCCSFFSMSLVVKNLFCYSSGSH